MKKITSKNENSSTDNTDKVIFELEFENSRLVIISTLKMLDRKGLEPFKTAYKNRVAL